MTFSTEEIKNINSIHVAWLQLFASCCDYMIQTNNHDNPVQLEQKGYWEGSNELAWNEIKQTNGFQDEGVTVENAAYGLSLLLFTKRTDYKYPERRAKGGKVDYWLHKEPVDESDNIFSEESIRLEVKGTGKSKYLKSRLKSAEIQVSGLESMISATEFKTPLIHVEKVKL